MVYLLQAGEGYRVSQPTNDQGLPPTHLIIWVIVLLQVGVGQGLFHSDPTVRVEGQHLVQQVQG